MRVFFVLLLRWFNDTSTALVKDGLWMNNWEVFGRKLPQNILRRYQNIRPDRVKPSSGPTVLLLTPRYRYSVTCVTAPSKFRSAIMLVLKTDRNGWSSVACSSCRFSKILGDLWCWRDWLRGQTDRQTQPVSRAPKVESCSFESIKRKKRLNMHHFKLFSYLIGPDFHLLQSQTHC